MENKSIIIIGAGFAGLSVGIYAQMNGYRTQIFEMHNLSGGLCTACKTFSCAGSGSSRAVVFRPV